MTRLRVVFFGTPQFAATILEFLLKNDINIVGVVTKPNKKVGRFQKMTPTPVSIAAEKAGLPLFQPVKARDPSFVETLKELNGDLFVVVAYSEIFNDTLLSLPPLGCINVHGSLLPKYRGAAPIERCVMAGEKKTGVTIMKMVKELDAGDMLKVVETPIEEEMTSGDLYKILSKLGGEGLLEVIQKFERKEKVVATEQNHSIATFAPKVTSQDGEVDWNREAKELHNQIRGVTPRPGAWCLIKLNGNVQRFIIKKSSVELSLHAPPGVILSEKGLVVGCHKGALRLLEVQLEGKKPLPTEEFLKGYPKEKLQFIVK